jgi:hypothetical protein
MKALAPLAMTRSHRLSERRSSASRGDDRTHGLPVVVVAALLLLSVIPPSKRDEHAAVKDD